MCGIVGAVIKARNGFTKPTEDSFTQMLFADTLRGDDSTGIIYVHNDGGFGIAKEAYAAPYVIDAIMDIPEVKQMYSRGKAYIGHNRKKTVGSISNETAHPFVVNDTFAMVHNGTLRNHKELADTVVDSEALAIHLSKVLTADFNKETFEEAMGKVNGAYAVVAYNQDTDCVYITRNAERPLTYVETTDGWFWASEGAMLGWILGRNGINLKDVQFKSLAPNSLLTINLDKNTATVMEYVPKKAIPATTVAGTKVKVITAKTPQHGSKPNRLSKQQFKTLKRKWFGDRLFFYADDYVEKNFPRTIMDGETDVMLIGNSDEFTFDHTVSAPYNINSLPKGEWEFTDCFFTGIVEDMTFDKATGWVTFHLTGGKLVPPHKKETPLVIDAEYIAKKLDEREAAEATQEGIDRLEKEYYETTTTVH
jgi:predicted glutamine amidotransferase